MIVVNRNTTREHSILCLMVMLVCIMGTLSIKRCLGGDPRIISSPASLEEPDLRISFLVGSEVLDGQLSINGEFDALKVDYGKDVDVDKDFDLKVSAPSLLTAEFKNNDKHVVVLSPSADLPRSEGKTVDVTLTARGPDGRSNTQTLRVFMNSGTFVGAIVPNSVSGKTTTSQRKLSGVTFKQRNRFEGTVIYIDENANGSLDAGEPVTVVDANNQFRFPRSQAYFREKLIRPDKLWVDGKLIDEANKGKFLDDPKNNWFHIETVAQVHGEVTGGHVAPPTNNPTVTPMATPVAAAAANAVQPESALRVNAASTAMTPDGSSWSNAYPSLEEALAIANDAQATIKQIWVAQGVYTPKADEHFDVNNGVKLYGGFLGVEKSLNDRPKIIRGTTILSGDVDGNDGHFARVNSVAASLDRQMFATASEDRSIKLWEADGNQFKLTATLRGHLQQVNGVAFSPDGTTLVSGGDDMTVRFWDVATGKLVHTIVPSQIDQEAHFAAVNTVCYSDAGAKVATAGEDQIIYVWDAQTHEHLASLTGHEGEITSLVFLPDDRIASASADRTIRIWDIDAPGQAVQVLDEHAGSVTHLSLGPNLSTDAPALVSASLDGSVRVWKTDGISYQLASEATSDFGPVHSMEMGKQNDLFAVHLSAKDAKPKPRLAVWNVETGRLEDTHELEFSDLPACLAQLAPVAGELDSSFRLVGGLDDGSLGFWDISPVSKQMGQETFTAAAMSADGSKIAYGNSDGKMLVKENGQNIVDLDFGMGNGIHCIAFDPTGTWVAVGFSESLKTILLSDPSMTDDFAQIHPDGITCVSYSEDGTRIVTGGKDKTVKVWNTEDSTSPLKVFGGHLKPVTCVGITGVDEKAVVFSGSEDRTLKVWQLQDAPQRNTIPFHASVLDCTLFGEPSEPQVVVSVDRVQFAPVRLVATEPITLQGNQDIDGIGTQKDNRVLVIGQDDPKTNGIYLVKENAWIRADDSTLAEDFVELKPVKILEGQQFQNQSAVFTGTSSPTIDLDPISFAIDFPAVKVKAELPLENLAGLLKIDGVQTAANDRVLVAGQVDASQNGIYMVQTQAWTRAGDPTAYVQNRRVVVNEGRLHHGELNICTVVESGSITPRPILFKPKTDKPALQIWQWKLSEEDNPTITQLADLSTTKVVRKLDAVLANKRLTIVAGTEDGAVDVWERNDDAAPLQQIKRINNGTKPLIALNSNATGRSYLVGTAEFLRKWERDLIRDPAKKLHGFFSPDASIQDNAQVIVNLPINAKDVSIDGFTIQGAASPDTGGGLKAAENVDADIVNCLIAGNRAKTNGGGAYVDISNEITWTECLFAHNQAENNGGGLAATSPAKLNSCIFYGNKVANNGGGLWGNTDAKLTLTQCIFYDCQAKNGSAIMNESAGSTLHLTTIAHNPIDGTAGFAVQSADDVKISFDNSIIAFNFQDNDPKQSADVKSSIDLPTTVNNLLGAKVETPDELFKDPLPSSELPAPWQALTSAQSQINYRLNLVPDPVTGQTIDLRLVFGQLFRPFGDYGGKHPTLEPQGDSIAVDLIDETDIAIWDQRGTGYKRNYNSEDAGAIELQPLPAAQEQEVCHVNTQGEVRLIDVSAESGSPKINATLQVDEIVPSSQSIVTRDGSQVSYQLNNAASEDGFIGRDEFQFTLKFGPASSGLTKATVWIVPPAEVIAGELVHRFVVDTETDSEITQEGVVNFRDGGLSLREAMWLASKTPEDDLIEFSEKRFNEPRVIQLTSSLDLDDGWSGSLTIVGPGAEMLTIIGANSGPALNVDSQKDSVDHIALSHLSFRGCDVGQNKGGAVLVDGSTEVMLENVGFVGNKAGTGSAIYTKSAKVTVSECTFALNVGDKTVASGVAATDPNPASVSNSIFWQNKMSDNTTVIDESTQYDNTNFTADPRFAITSSDPETAMGFDLRIRRDSLAFDLKTIQIGGDESELLVSKGAYAPRFKDQQRIPPSSPGYVKEATPFGTRVIYCDASVSDRGNGESWETAYKTLDDALERAAVDYSVATIQVAKGRYVPTSGFDLPRTNTPGKNLFILQHGLSIQGGFPSSADVADSGNDLLRNVSVPFLYPTHVSQDLTTDPELADGMILASKTSQFSLSNLEVAEVNSLVGALVGKQKCVGKLQAVYFHGNKNHAISLEEGTLSISQSTFTENICSSDSADGGGGAILLKHDDAILNIDNSTFFANQAAQGGAILVQAGTLDANFLTIFGNKAAADANTNGGGLFAKVDVNITNSILCENIGGDLHAPNEAALSPSNAVGKNWNGRLLGKLDYHPYLKEGKYVHAPTPTTDVLPQVPYRLRLNSESLVDKVELSEGAGDQRGPAMRPSPEGSKADFGAVERQYFQATPGGTTVRYFVVNDQETGIHLWAEIPNATNPSSVLPVYLQLSQHTGNDQPRVQHADVTDDSITYRQGDSAFIAEKSTTGFVNPATIFPAHNGPLLDVDRAIRSVNFKGESAIKVSLVEVGVNTMLQIDDDGPMATGSHKWTVTHQPDTGDAQVQTFTEPSFSIAADPGTYVIEMTRDTIAIPSVTFKIENVE